MSKFTIEPWASVEIPTNGGNGETFVEIKNPDAVDDGEVVIDVVGGDFARKTAWLAVKSLGGDPDRYHRREVVRLEPFEQKRVTLLYAGAIASIKNQSTTKVDVSH